MRSCEVKVGWQEGSSVDVCLSRAGGRGINATRRHIERCTWNGLK